FRSRRTAASGRLRVSRVRAVLARVPAPSREPERAPRPAPAQPAQPELPARVDRRRTPCHRRGTILVLQGRSSRADDALARGGSVAQVILMLALVAGAYFVFLRPQRRRQMAKRDLLGSLEPGEEIVSTGGIFGVIKSVDGDDLHVEIADGCVVRMARRAVAGLVEPEEAATETESAEEPKSPEMGAEPENPS